MLSIFLIIFISLPHNYQPLYQLGRCLAAPYSRCDRTGETVRVVALGGEAPHIAVSGSGRAPSRMPTADVPAVNDRERGTGPRRASG